MESLIGAYLFALFVYCLTFGFFCGWLAVEKGRSFENWFGLGFFFGFFALLALGLAPSLKAEKMTIPPTLQGLPQPTASSGQVQSTPLIEELKQCQDCMELIKLHARKCRFCGSEFTKDDVETHIKEHHRGKESQESAERLAQELAENEKKLAENRKLAKSSYGLRRAIIASDADQVDELLRLGADPDREFDSGSKPLEYAIEKGNARIVKALLDSGAAIPKKSNLLHLAVRIGSAEILQTLIMNGANIDEKNLLRLTALQVAEKRNPRYEDVISVLKAAPINFQCPKCKTIFKVSQEFRGKQGTCRTCNTRIKVPK
jgi:hypothetical protein